MKPKSFERKRPEAKIQERLIFFLEGRGWLVKETHGGMLQAGFPDLYCTHGTIMGGHSAVRWVEVKLPNMKGSVWTKAQKKEFPKLCNNGSPIWILTAATEYEYKKLFLPFNFWEYFIKII